MKRVTIRLSDELFEQFEQAALKAGVTRAALLNKWIKNNGTISVTGQQVTPSLDRSYSFYLHKSTDDLLQQHAKKLKMSKSNYLRRLIEAQTHGLKPDDTLQHIDTDTLERARKTHLIGNFSEFIRTYEKLAEQDATLQILLADSYAYGGKFKEALLLLDILSEQSLSTEDQLFVQSIRLDISFHCFNKKEAIEQLKALRKLQDEAEDDRESGLVSFYQARHSFLAGKIDKGFLLFEETIEHLQTNKHLLLIGRTYYTLFDAQLKFKVIDENQLSKYIRNVASLAKRYNSTFLSGMHEYMKGRYQHFVLLDPESSIVHYQTALKHFKKAGAQFFYYDSLGFYSFAQASAGKHEQYEQIVKEGLAIEKSFGRKVYHNNLHSQNAVIQASKGDLLAAKRLMKFSETFGFGHFTEITGPMLGIKFLYSKKRIERTLVKSAFMAIRTARPNSVQARMADSIMKNRKLILR